MEEIKVPGQEVVHQGDVREYFYVVENALMHCFIKPDSLPPPAFTAPSYIALSCLSAMMQWIKS